MARLRKFVAYRGLERPYTRASKYKKQNFVRAVPHNTIVRYEMGDPKAKFDTTLNLISGAGIQIRHNAIESARQTTNKLLETSLGKNEYFFKIMMYPFHVLRENPLASGAGADRMSTGMKKSFGKPIGLAAQVRPGKILMQVKVNKKNLATAKKALKRASQKLPCSCKIIIAS
ncbi:50S ribosomal protein L16 [Candidatus Woesearchaeota archaeon]|nr:50S ribosomal protein L16 [Candidatus Woesearchaeota archaeon]